MDSLPSLAMAYHRTAIHVTELVRKATVRDLVGQLVGILLSLAMVYQTANHHEANSGFWDVAVCRGLGFVVDKVIHPVLNGSLVCICLVLIDYPKRNFPRMIFVLLLTIVADLISRADILLAIGAISNRREYVNDSQKDKKNFFLGILVNVGWVLTNLTFPHTFFVLFVITVADQKSREAILLAIKANLSTSPREYFNQKEKLGPGLPPPAASEARSRVREIDEAKAGVSEEVDERIVRKLDKEEVPEGTPLLQEDLRPDRTWSSENTVLYFISPNGRFKHNIKFWQKGEYLGGGSFGAVFRAITNDGFFFAVKEVTLRDDKEKIYRLQQEILILSQLEHENIVQYLGTDKDDSKLYIFLELATKGSLEKVYQKCCLQDPQVSAYTKQILIGLNYLHSQNVVHRDIKCANILVDASGSVKLADFGLAKATKLNDIKSFQGSAFWMAPEVVNPKKGYGLEVDIWSLGCTVLEMLTRKHPYPDLEQVQALFKIGRGILPNIPDYLSSDAQDFILKCLKVDPNDRPTAAQLLDHPFVKRPESTFLGPASP